jgi:diguanylate cyclase (GGDEF)-like protein
MSPPGRDLGNEQRLPPPLEQTEVDPQHLCRALAVEMFERTRVSSVTAYLCIALLVYPNIAAVPWRISLGWCAAMSLLLALRILLATSALRDLARKRDAIPLVHREMLLALLLGLGWGGSVFLFSKGAADEAFYTSLVVLSALVAFILSSTSIFLRVYVVYTSSVCLTVAAFIAAHDFLPAQLYLFSLVIIYLAMNLVLAVATNRRFRTSMIEHLALKDLTAELNRALAEERMLQDKLEKSALTDELTEVLNRRGTVESLGRELARCQRFGWPLALLMIDVDHFKSVNDSLGHAVGDKVLRQLARTIQGGLRDMDMIGRWGGEEFVVTLSVLERAAAIATAERLRAAVAAIDFGADGIERKVTISVGVGFHPPADCVEQLIADADAALYAAKHGGRDRVCAAPS